MSRNQWIILGTLGVAVVLVFGCLGGVVLTYLTGQPPTETPTATVSSTPTRTPTPVLPTPTPEPPPPPTRIQEPTEEQPTATHTPIPPTFTPTPQAPALTPTPEPPTATPTSGRTEARVTSVIDGDTIEVELDGQTYRLRYIGIECPEPGQYGCEQATQANRQLVEGKTVRLEKDVSETDQYGRLLRYVYVGGIFVNAELVRSGYATAWTYPPDVAHSDLFVQLEGEAREAGHGLWAAPTPTSGPGWSCAGNIYNCGDFSSCTQVMSYWHACPGDPSRLDGDHDGRPCESLCR